MKEELPTKRRIAEIGINELNFNHEDLRKIHYAYQKLLVLKKGLIPEMQEEAKEIFERDKTIYQERMNWINEFVNSKGFNEKLFTNINDYKISSDDYDYYYELKTPAQLKEEEEARKQKKAAKEEKEQDDNDGSRE